jgi:hypothetical protein
MYHRLSAGSTIKAKTGWTLLGAELATVPSKIFQEWAGADFPMPDHDFVYKAVDAKGKSLKPIPYRDLDLNLPWDSFDLAHELTTKGISEIRG